MDYKVGDRITITSDVNVKYLKRETFLRKGEKGTVTSTRHDTTDGSLYIVRFDSCGWDVWINSDEMVHAVDELALLRAQLAAREAALDAVLELAHDPTGNHSRCDSPGEVALRRKFAELLLKHGVHPK